MTSVGRWADVRQGAVLFEDEAALVLNKPAGISVMGERHETDLVRLAEEAGEELFPVHRIDKVTSGAILFAKELRHHGDLTRQFNKRTVGKSYLAITRTSEVPGDGGGGGGALPARGTIELPLGVGRKNRVRVAGNREDIVVSEDGRRWSLGPADGGAGGSGGPGESGSGSAGAGAGAGAGGGWGSGGKKSYPSQTDFARAWGDERHDLLAVHPVTGRRHQIRVHLAWIGHPIEGDPLFDKAAASRGDRCALHAWRLAFDAAWAGGRRIEVEAAPGADFWGVLGEDAHAVPEGVLDGVRERIAR